MKMTMRVVTAATVLACGVLTADHTNDVEVLPRLMQQISKLAAAGFYVEARELLLAKTNDPAIAAMTPSLLALIDSSAVAAAPAPVRAADDDLPSRDTIRAALAAGDWSQAAHAAYLRWQRTGSPFDAELYDQCVGQIFGLLACSNIVFVDWQVSDNCLEGTWVNNADATIKEMEVSLRMKSNGVVLAEENDTVIYDHTPLKPGQHKVWRMYFSPPRAWRGELDLAITRLVIDVTNRALETVTGITCRITQPLHVILLTRMPEMRCATHADVRSYAAAMRRHCSDTLAAALVSQTVVYVQNQLTLLARVSNEWLAACARGGAPGYQGQASAALCRVHVQLALAHAGMKDGYVFYSNTWMPLASAKEQLAAEQARRNLERFRAAFTSDTKRLPPRFAGDDFDSVYYALQRTPRQASGRLCFFVTAPTGRTSTGNGVHKDVSVDRGYKRYHTIPDDEVPGNVEISRTLLDESEYEANNAFGAKVVVTKREYLDRLIAAQNINELFREMNQSRYVSGFGFDPLPKRALNVLKRLRILLVCKVLSARTGFKYVKPTFDRPIELVVDQRIIDARIVHIWLFDVESGEILSKHPVRM